MRRNVCLGYLGDGRASNLHEAGGRSHELMSLVNQAGLRSEALSWRLRGLALLDGSDHGRNDTTRLRGFDNLQSTPGVSVWPELAYQGLHNATILDMRLGGMCCADGLRCCRRSVFCGLLEAMDGLLCDTLACRLAGRLET